MYEFEKRMEEISLLLELNNDVHPLEKELFDMMLEASDKKHILINIHFYLL